MPLPILVIAGVYLLRKLLDEPSGNSSYKETTPSPSLPPPPPPIEQIICFIGRVSSGKSSTANSLLGFNAFKTGEEHGTTSSSYSIDYKNDYQLLDTPGLLDSINYEDEIIYQALRSKIIVYVVTGQLFQEELDFVRKIYLYHLTTHKLLLFVNKQDTKEHSMPSLQREKERALIKEQVKNWIRPDDVVFGSSSPKENGKTLPPQIADLKKIINKYM